MKKGQITGRTRFVRNATAAAVMAACASSAMAWDYETDGGWKINVSTIATAASSWRVEGRDKSLIMYENAISAGLTPNVATTPAAAYQAAAIASGYRGGSRTDSSNLNYDKGDRYSTIFKFITDLEFKKGDTGGLIRVKGWYDQALKDETVPYGHQNNGYAGAIGSGTAATARVPGGAPLSDKQFDPLNRFDGLFLLDAYVYTGFDVGSMPAQVRVGRQAVNWGESVFIQGINQLAPLDVPSLRRAGTEIKEALLPVWSITGNIGLGNGMSIDAFYQLKWERTVVDSCGTYWGPSEGKIGNGQTACNMATALAGSNAAYYNGNSALGGAPFTLIPGLAISNANALNPLVTPAGITSPYPKGNNPPGAEPHDNGQWGLSFRFPIEAIDTEFGVYAMNIHSRVPVVSAQMPTLAQVQYAAGKAALAGNVAANTATLTPIIGAAAAGPTAAAIAGAAGTFAVVYAANGISGGWSYPEDVKIFGLSAATNIAGVSVGAELSYQKDVPVQVNGNDLLDAAISFAGGKVLTMIGSPQGAINLANGGPLGARAVAAGYGGIANGYDLFNKTQFQLNAVGALPAILGAVSGLAIGEVGFQWNNVPQGGNNVRYGRSFIFGVAQSPLYTGNSNFGAAVLGCDVLNSANRNPTGCANDGFVTDFAWGYRLRASLDYPGFMDTGWVATPSIFWAHDVSGVSMDTQFNEGKKTVSLGLKFNLNKTHNIDFTYTTYANSAKYDLFRDKDNASVSYSYTF